MKQQHYNRLIKFSSFLLVLLFAYAGFSKMLGIGRFRENLGQVEAFKNMAGAIAVAIPIVEILTALCITIPALKSRGLWLAALLMTGFTLYVSGMLLSKTPLPCSCGGVIAAMSWRQHLYFNIFFMCLSWGLLYINNRNKRISTNKRE